MTTFQYAPFNGLKLFYREAGSKASPTIVLLHGFPSSSHMFRDLIPQLAEKFHVIAPDYIGFGYSDAPDAGTSSTPSTISPPMSRSCSSASSGSRSSASTCRTTARLSAIESPQTSGRDRGHRRAERQCLCRRHRRGLRSMKPFWANRNAETEKPVRELLKKETTIFQYTHGVKDVSRISPTPTPWISSSSIVLATTPSS
jgi:hypothetical protein